MRRLVTLILALVLVLAVAPPVAANHGQPGKLVPFQTAFTAMQTGMDFSGTDPAAVRCDPPAVGPAAWFSTFDGQGDGTRVGPYVEHNTHCAYATGPTTGIFNAGESTITADNGDTLTLTYSGTWVLDLVEGTSVIDEVWTITGGTGRFVDATGSGTGHLVQSLETSVAVGTYTGSIAYDASHRSDT